METKSSWLSKINWTQIVGLIATVIGLFGFDLPMEQQVELVAAIQAIQAAVTIIMRTWFTKKLTKASVG